MFNLLQIMALGVVLLSRVAAAQCPEVLPPPLKTVCANQPARAEDMNTNFKELNDSIVRKTGSLDGGAMVNTTSISTPSLVVNGTATVSSLTGTGLVQGNPLGVKIYSDSPTTAYTFSGANVWGDSDLSVTFTIASNSSGLLTPVQIHYVITGASSGQHLVTRVMIDDVEELTGRCISGNAIYWTNLATVARTLGPGTHTVKVQYRTPGGAVMNPATSDFSTRSLQVLVFGTSSP